MQSVLKRPSMQQFFKFAGVGILSFLVDWLMLIVLVETFHVDVLIGTTVSFLTSVALNYVLSMRYVFEHRDDMSRKREFTIFAILSCIGLGLNDLYMFIGVTMLNIGYQAMKVIATFCVTWYNFFTRKKFLAS
ncbi:GtrA family protein [Collinsella sp. An2]|uniref:GtrA family protein n=1 Tax=Collinsella sp. An2 TaxID=1965585 RepID=UPI000B3708B1|nr:GtrA family protein [Collinsella sp. An2]OUP07091.1 sugar translocase [Collinsella sp. An2]